MPNLDEMIHDLNVTIADIETFKIQNQSNMPKDASDSTARAIGQLKAARTSLATTLNMLTVHGVNQKGGKN